MSTYTVQKSVNLGAARTGLDLLGQLYDGDGVVSGEAIELVTQEPNPGEYFFLLTLDTDFQGRIKVYAESDPTIFRWGNINPPPTVSVSDEQAAAIAADIAGAMTFDASAFTGAFPAGVLVNAPTGASESDAGNTTIVVESTTGAPLQGASVRITSDAAGLYTVAGPKFTNAFGKVVFNLPIGTFYAWMQLSGENFPDPQVIVVTGQ